MRRRYGDSASGVLITAATQAARTCHRGSSTPAWLQTRQFFARLIGAVAARSQQWTRADAADGLVLIDIACK
jgi:hypothetical protein